MKKFLIISIIVAFGTWIVILLINLNVIKIVNYYSKQEIEAIQILYYTQGFREGQECGYITRKGIVKGVRLVDTLAISPENMQEILDSEIATTYPRYSLPDVGGSK